MKRESPDPLVTQTGSRPWRSASAIIAGPAATGYHLLKIDGYSRTMAVVRNGEQIKSCPFSVGSCWWRIGYYPNGDRPESADYVSLYLYIDDTVAQAVNAQFEFSLLDQVGERVSSHTRTSEVRSFATTQRSWGYGKFIKRGALERSEHLKNDCFRIRCDITVMGEIRTEKMEVHTPSVAVPPSELHDHFGHLLQTKEGADVTFQVGMKTFPAHRCMLAARSPVFKAHLCGPMKASATIRIYDMDPEVFRTLLHFLYTDSLPEMNDQEAVMTRCLLVAADRYNIETLKLMCEEELCKHIDTSTVAKTLVLAEQHHCRELKETCYKFLKSPANLKAVVVTEGFEHLTRSCPSLLKELITMVAGCPRV